MRQETKSITDFSFSFEIIDFGEGFTGATPMIVLSDYDGNFWDGSAWSTTYTEFSMLEPDATNFPGLYVYNFTEAHPSITLDVSTKYLVKILEEDVGLMEYIQVDTIIDSNIISWVGTAVSVTSDLPTVYIPEVIDANVIDWNSTAPTLTKSTSGYPNVNTATIDTSIAADVAEAVWNSSLEDHEAAGSFGNIIQIIAGLVHFNHRIKDTEYDSRGRMIGARIALYRSAEDADADENIFASFVIQSTYNSSNNMTSYTATKES